MGTTVEPNAYQSELISSAAQGDLEAFNGLVLKYQDMVYRQARSILGDDEYAQDATQETFISAFQHLRSFRGGSFRAWLLRIATNHCYDVLRAEKRRPTTALDPVDANGGETESPAWLVDPHPSPQAALEADEFSQTVYRWLDELPTQFRTVVTLIDLNGISYVEASRALGIPTGTVKSRLARARLRMKERLSQERGTATGLESANPGTPAIHDFRTQAP